MNDPWDVKSVRQSSQYVSCMKINGVPLLPPLLSKECRKEMQYYKILAKEVEKRISVLQPYILDSDTESSDDKTDAPELPECEQNYEFPNDDIKAGFHLNLDKVNVTEDALDENNLSQPPTNLFNSLTSNVTVVEAAESVSGLNSPKFIIDLSLNINDAGRLIKDTTRESLQCSSTPADIPERDDNNRSKNKIQKELLIDCELGGKSRKVDQSEGKVNFIVNVNGCNKNGVSDIFTDLSVSQDGPSSLSAKSFTGSLNDIHTDSMRESQIIPKLVRQRSYTLLKPGPQLLAHLEVQSLSTGVEMSSISMSESLSNLNTPGKKRRSWDLESAKVKWSSMALELKQKQMINAGKLKTTNKTVTSRPTVKGIPHISSPSTKSAVTEKVKQSSVNKNLSKSEPIQKGKRILSPVRNTLTKVTAIKAPATSNPVNNSKEYATPKSAAPLISESDDPATRVRELYEKIQTQQLIQMANLVEKQKREQMLLQQVFEEQNNLLYKQLKTICPKSSSEVQEVLGDTQQGVERGPVSLSQLINHRSPDQSLGDSSLSSTLTDTNHYINHCDNVLKKSRDITGSMRKQQTKVQNQNETKLQSPRNQAEMSRTRTHSPTPRNSSISRRLNYDTSASSEREYELILTDRTNDTMAGLNVTFPSDSSEDFNYNKAIINHLCGKEVTVLDVDSIATNAVHYRSTTDSRIRSIEKPVSDVLTNGANRTTKSTVPVKINPPTPKERAAATTVVAYAKGFLVRRLMRTERVQGIVQTIKDALLCALQLHQDREGIRGADVDLHRRLIQQITAACYSLHDAFIASTAGERCAMIAADRSRRRSLAARQPQKSFRQTDKMSQSYSGAIPSRSKRLSSASLMTQSNYETFSGKCTPVSRSRHMSSPRRRPWR